MTRLFMFIPYICVSFVIISRVVCVNSFDLRSTEFPRTPFAQLFRNINTLRPAFFNNLRGKTLSGYSSNTSATLMAALRRSHKPSPVIVRSPTAFSQLFTEMVDDFYYRGISTLDIISWVNEPENKTAFSRIELSNIMMCFYRIKPEFRCEKMLMFYMLHFMFCSNFELP